MKIQTKMRWTWSSGEHCLDQSVWNLAGRSVQHCLDHLGWSLAWKSDERCLDQ
jgi:hypothetical protein